MKNIKPFFLLLTWVLLFCSVVLILLLFSLQEINCDSIDWSILDGSNPYNIIYLLAIVMVIQRYLYVITNTTVEPKPTLENSNLPSILSNYADSSVNPSPGVCKIKYSKLMILVFISMVLGGLLILTWFCELLYLNPGDVGLNVLFILLRSCILINLLFSFKRLGYLERVLAESNFTMDKIVRVLFFNDVEEMSDFMITRLTTPFYISWSLAIGWIIYALAFINITIFNLWLLLLPIWWHYQHYPNPNMAYYIRYYIDLRRSIKPMWLILFENSVWFGILRVLSEVSLISILVLNLMSINQYEFTLFYIAAGLIISNLIYSLIVNCYIFCFTTPTDEIIQIDMDPLPSSSSRS